MLNIENNSARVFMSQNLVSSKAISKDGDIFIINNKSYTIRKQIFIKLD